MTTRPHATEASPPPAGRLRTAISSVGGDLATVALAKRLLHLLTTGAFGYGFFVDELYYLAVSKHLALGFVEMPPLLPALTAAVRALLGESLLAIRLVPALAGAALVVMTGLFARELGGGKLAGLLAGLGVLTARQLLRRRGAWIAAGTAFLVFLPNLAWNVAHGFPHLAHLAQVRADGRDVALSPLSFLGQQVQMLHPLAVVLWGGGLLLLLFHPFVRSARFLGVAFVALIGLMLLLDGRVYYPAPAYPVLLAAGGVAVERFASTLARRRLVTAYAALLLLTGMALAPAFVPCLPPAVFVRYAEATGLEQPRIETHSLGPLPQLHADRFGWEEMAREVARVYHALPPGDRSRAGIFGQNYGQAGAIDLFGPALGLPLALSGHLAYHDWGPRGFTGEVLIVLDDDRATLEGHFESVEWAGHVEHRWSMPYQHFDVWVCRGLKRPLPEVWPALKKLG